MTSFRYITWIVALFLLVHAMAANWTPSVTGNPDIEYYLLTDSAGEYLAIHGGGLWHRSEDSNWQAANHSLNLPVLADIDFIEATDRAGRSLYASGYSWNPAASGSWYSLDCGQTWNAVPSEWITNHNTSRMLISLHDSTLLYHLSDRYLRKSRDSGANWESFELDGFERTRTKIIEDPYSDSTMYIVTQSSFADENIPNGELLISHDQGETWMNALNLADLFHVNYFTTSDVLPLLNSTLLLAVSLADGSEELGTGILLSQDNGESWEAVSNGLPSLFGAKQLVLKPGTTDQIIANGIHHHGLFLSQDGGESWTSFNEGFPFERIHINNIVSRNDTLYTYTRNSGIFRLDNGTDTWMPYEITSRQFGARGELSFVYPRMFLSEQANRMWRLQEEWAECQVDLPANVYTHINPPLPWEGNRLISYCSSRFNLFTPDTCWFSSSSDDGQEWTGIDIPIVNCEGARFQVFEFSDAHYLVGFTQSVIRYRNSINDNWSTFVPPIPFLIQDITADSMGILVLIRSSGDSTTNVLRIHPSLGEIESLNYNGPPATNYSHIWTHANTVYISALQNCVRNAENNEWEILGSIPRSSSVQEMVVVPTLVPIFIGRVYLSTNLVMSFDGGFSWSDYDLGPAINEQGFGLMDIEIDTFRQVLWASTSLGSAYVSFNELHMLSSLEPYNKGASTKTRLISISPNPTNNNVTIQIALDKQSVVTIALYNINGQMLETIVEDVFPSGLLSKSVSLTKYASGVYFMRTNLNAQTSIDKIHLLK